jgi:D-alanyl-lipoteichoic acid acyltransferase DltB (MBOAT superfamily)
MILSLDLLCFVLALSVPLFWAIPQSAINLRHSFLIFISLIILYFISPVIALSAIAYVLIILIILWVAARGLLTRKTIKKLSWFAFLPLLIPEFISPDVASKSIMGAQLGGDNNFMAMAYLGLAFTGIRAFLTIRDAISQKPPSAPAMITSLAFFGSYLAGPIASGKIFGNIAPRLSLYNLAMGISRIGWGAALVLIISPYVSAANIAVSSQLLTNWAEMYRKFITLFLDFSGASSCAIGIALLYGIKLPENFHFPLLATSVQNFWQRWHISFSSLIGTYLFKPLVRTTGKTSFSLIASFMLVGMWHHINLQYIIWGAGHGIALAVQRKLQARYDLNAMTPQARITILVLGWMFTITYVSFLSTFANSASWHDAVTYMRGLVGIT